MKTTSFKPRARQQGWAILVVMSLAATCLLLMASVLTWANENAAVTARASEVFTTSYAAEAATEKSLGSLIQDYENYGVGICYTKTASGAYASLVPNSSDNSYWTNYAFSGGASNGQVIVECLNTNITNWAGAPYTGLQYVGSEFEIIANAKNTSSMYGITATVGQEVVLGQIPIFQFAVFYNDTMEIAPGANMVISGTVHGNTNIYIDPNSGATLTFSNDISATGTVNNTWSPLNPSYNSPMGTITFDGNNVSGVIPLNLPVGTNNSGNTTNVGLSVYAVLQPPLAGESPNSTVGTNRLYNQVDMIITISNGNVFNVTSGIPVDGAATTLSNRDWGVFLNTNGAFYNMRDGSEVAPVDINEGALRQWSATNTTLRPLLASLRGAGQASVQSIYVADERFLSNTIITTNVSYTTNYASTTTSYYPSTNYVPPVTTNTTETTSGTFPTNGSYVPPIQTTNVTATTTTNSPSTNAVLGTITNTITYYTNVATYPSAGSYTGSVTTNTTSVTTTNKNILNGLLGNAIGDILGAITTNNVTPKTYTYNQITGYSYQYSTYSYALITGYIYNGITGYTYSARTGVTTNYTYTTNYTEFAEPGIVLTNGGQLPTNGLSIVTPDPAYIVGNWNVTNSAGQGLTQTFNVADTLPSAIYADAITILSPAWTPTASTNALTSRVATPDTVNAAILTGNVPSNGSYYSGGVENFVRFQEDWSSVNFFYNGSMVEEFPSQIANYAWPGTGTVYNPPTRNWSFDTNFLNPADLPPLVPRVIYPARIRWTTLTPGTTVF